MFDLPIVCYLFLGGAAGGLGFFAALMGLLFPSSSVMLLHRRLQPSKAIYSYKKAQIGVLVAAAGLIALGSLCLLVDLGDLNQLLPLLVQPRWSFIAFGSYLLPVTAILEIVLGLGWYGSVFSRLWRGHFGHVLFKLAHGLLLVLSGAVMVYTGLFLASMRSVAFWHSFWLPVLFVLSSLSCGIALAWVVLIFAGTLKPFNRVFRKMVSADSVVLFLELVVLALLIVSLVSVSGDTTATQRAAAQSLSWLVAGGGTPWLFGGVVGLGLLLPLGFEFSILKMKRSTEYAVLLVVACVLVGAFLLRWVVVEAGVAPVLFN